MKVFKFQTGGQNPVSVVAIQEVPEDDFLIGVTIYGPQTKAERLENPLNLKRGLEIAHNRALKKPYSSLEKLTKAAFENYVGPMIVNNLHQQIQCNLKGYKRIN